MMPLGVKVILIVLLPLAGQAAEPLHNRDTVNVIRVDLLMVLAVTDVTLRFVLEVATKQRSYGVSLLSTHVLFVQQAHISQRLE